LKLLRKVIRFFFSSFTATSCDFILYLTLVSFLKPSISQIISYSLGMLINLTLQNFIVFDQARGTKSVLKFVITFWVIGLLWSSIFVHYITKVEFFMDYQPITKLIVIGMMFSYNYLTRKFSFEGSL